MKFKFIIRAAKIEDMAAVAKMIQDLAIYHKMPQAAKMTVKDLEQDGFKCQPPAFKCQVAEADNQVVGYTIYFNAYSSWDGRAMLLEDLYVMREQRKKGIGEALFDAVAKNFFFTMRCRIEKRSGAALHSIPSLQETASTGCARLDFHVVQWNKATSFYQSKGAVNLTEKEQWCYFRLTGDALKRYADKINCIPKK